MNDAEAAAVIENLQRAVIATHPGPIRRAFSALVARDIRDIRHRAEQDLARIDRAVLDALRQADDDPQHRLTLDVFHASVLEPLQDKPAAVEPAVVHDIETWIEANATAVASANLRIMEAALPDEAPPQAHRSLIEFHQHIDFAACEAEQQAALQRIWSAIEARIAALLADAPKAS